MSEFESPNPEAEEADREMRGVSLANEIADLRTRARSNEDYQVILEKTQALKELFGVTSNNAELGREVSEQIDRAKELLGEENVITPDKIKEIFDAGIDLEAIEPIPFSQKELEAAKELGQFLIYRPTKDNSGNPMTMERVHEILNPKFDESTDGQVLYDTDWYENEKFFTEQIPRGGWALVSKEPIPETIDKNYVDQTRLLAEHIQRVMQDIPDENTRNEYQAMIDEFSAAEESLKGLISSDWEEAAKQLSELRINQSLRQQPVEALIDMTAYYKNSGERILEENYTWTNQRSSDGRLVRVGRFDSDGADVDGDEPGLSDGGLGVSFSRNL